MYTYNWAVVVPMANEGHAFSEFIREMTVILNRLKSGVVYIVVDEVSSDNTYKLSIALSKKDVRFKTIWAPENRNIVDAYLRGYREAYTNGHEIIIEMDAGMSHDPKAIPMFLRVLNEGNECAFGSRFINGGSMTDSTLMRKLLSRGGTLLANTLLGTRLFDMTSGFQGFHADVIGKLLKCELFSTAHFFQTEVRYLLRNHRYAEIPIHYKAPSPSVSRKAIMNSLIVLLHYLGQRIIGRSKVIT